MLSVDLGPGQVALLEVADGARTVGKLLAHPALAAMPAPAREEAAREFFVQMRRLGHLLFARACG